jgi:hypothetical protein
MGGGPKPPNANVIPKASGDLLDDSGKLDLECPEDGYAVLTQPTDLRLGSRGVLAVVGDQVAFLVNGRDVGHLEGSPKVKRLMKCLQAEFTYVAELELNNGESRVRYSKT